MLGRVDWFTTEFSKFGQKCKLSIRGGLGRIDLNLEKQIAPAAPLKMRNALLTEADDLTGLRSRVDRNDLFTVESLEGNLGAEGGLCHRNVEFVYEIIVVADETLVRRDPYMYVKVAGGTLALANRTSAGETKGRSGVDAGRNIDGVRGFLDTPALATT
jgi:hypothetical protein